MTRKDLSSGPSPARDDETPPPLPVLSEVEGMEGIKGGCGTLFKEFQIRKRFFGCSSAHLFQRSKIRTYNRLSRFVINEATIIKAELHTPDTGRLAVRHARNW
ncbi:MAG: hypothetical protein HZA47_03190 [Planctomycetes bacterium]|nr:hypothetical protein [Planctomycetota bacterium]